MPTLEPPDNHHLDAAIGWLGLGCAADAGAELDQISAPNQSHLDVLEMRWTLAVHGQNWAEALAVAERELQTDAADAGGWLHRAYALRRMENGGLAAAWAALLPAADKFPAEPVIPYNLACYACQMAQLDDARQWLRRAQKIGGREAIQKMALADDDLQPLWPEMKKI